MTRIWQKTLHHPNLLLCLRITRKESLIVWFLDLSELSQPRGCELYTYLLSKTLFNQLNNLQTPDQIRSGNNHPTVNHGCIINVIQLIKNMFKFRQWNPLVRSSTRLGLGSPISSTDE